MSWPAAVPVMLLAALWLLGPGLLVGAAAGLRGLVAWGGAPLLSVCLSAVSAVAGGELGLAWGAPVPLAATSRARRREGVTSCGDEPHGPLPRHPAPYPTPARTSPIPRTGPGS